MEGVDVVKSIKGLIRWEDNCRALPPLISECEVRLRNLTILTSQNSSNGKCLHLENCQRFEISDCVLVSSSPSTDLAPYPARAGVSAALYCQGGRGAVTGCDISAPGLESRGIVVDQGAELEVEQTSLHHTWNSGLWARGGSTAVLKGSQVTDCGGYGAIYCTNGSSVSLQNTRQADNPRGCGVFVLHDSSRVFLQSSEFNGNKWSGFGCRWGGGGQVTDCSFDSNGQGAWAIRKSTIKDVVRLRNKVTNDFTDQQYKKVAFLFSDPLSTALVEKGLASRGLSVKEARRLVNNEIRMREATQFQAKFLSSCQ